MWRNLHLVAGHAPLASEPWGAVLGETLVVVVDAVVGDLARVEAGRAVLEGQSHAVQLRLHLVDRLLAEVSDVEQVGLAAPDELTH